MNIFGALTFGGLIKTFLPGFVWMIAFVILGADLAQMLGVKTELWNYLTNRDTAASLILAFPLSILLGLLSNIIVFMGFNDWLVRVPFEQTEKALFKIHQKLYAQLRDQCWDTLSWGNDPNLRADFHKSIDAEMILLERIDVQTISYVREQYWYHLEFQMNLIMSLVAVYLSSSLSAFLNAGDGQGPICLLWIWLATLLVLAICYGLLKAARKNYARHMSKMASLMTALLTQPVKAE